MKSLLKSLVFALTLTCAASAFAQSGSTAGQNDSPVPFPFDGKKAQGDQRKLDQQQLDKAQLLLSGYHGLPPKEMFVESLDDPKLVLTAMALDAKGPELHRKRALSALGYFADAGVERIYVDLLQDASTPEAIRHRLIFLLAEHFPADALAHLKPYLTHKNLQYRLSAIEAIRKLPSDDAVAALRDALQHEDNAVAKKRLQQYTQVAK